MGEYLAWFYEPCSSTRRRTRSRPPLRGGDGHHTRDRWTRDGVAGRRITLNVDHVVLTSGHTFNEERVSNDGEVHYLRPYPVEYFDDAVGPGEPVAIAGMGLVGYDLITALTTGAGGTYDEEGDRSALRAEWPRAGHLLLFALRRAVLREIRARRRPDR